MTTNKILLATTMTQRWHDFWRGEIGEWVITRGLHIGMLLIGAVLASASSLGGRAGDPATRRRFRESDALVARGNQAPPGVASVIQWVSIVLIAIWVVVQIASVLRFSMGGWSRPPRCWGGAGFGAQQLVKDLLSGSSSSWRSSTASAIWSS